MHTCMHSCKGHRARALRASARQPLSIQFSLFHSRLSRTRAHMRTPLPGYKMECKLQRMFKREEEKKTTQARRPTLYEWLRLADAPFIKLPETWDRLTEQKGRREDVRMSGGEHNFILWCCERRSTDHRFHLEQWQRKHKEEAHVPLAKVCWGCESTSKTRSNLEWQDRYGYNDATSSFVLFFF